MVSGTIVAPSSNLQLSPGSCVTIDNVRWDDYEFLLLEMGDRSCDRMIYSPDLGSMTMNNRPFLRQSVEPKPLHGYGSWEGKMIMSDDFDEPMEGFNKNM